MHTYPFLIRCDRILFKSTVIPDDEEEEPEEGPEQPRFPVFRVSQIFANFMRHRKDSNLSIGSTAESSAAASIGSTSAAHNLTSPISPLSADEAQQINALRLDSPEPSPARPRALNFNRPSSSKSHSQKSPPTSPRSATPEGVGMALRRSMSGPTTPAPPLVSSPPPMASILASDSPVDQLSPMVQPRRLSHGVTGSPATTPQSSTRRWLFPFGSSSREPTPTPPTVSLPHVEEVRHRRGDMVCLEYNTLDDRQMRQLEARSDHRPVVGDFAIYV